MALPLPIGSLKASAVGFMHAVVGSFIWGGEMKGIKKEREGWGLSLRRPPFGLKMQQPTKSLHKRWGRDWRREDTGVERVWGCRIIVFGVAN
jgi:hypothetical protein